MTGDDFLTVAMWTFIFNNAGIATDWISIYGMVNGEIAHIGIMHSSYQCFKGLYILGWISVHFHIGNMTSVFQLMIWGLDADFIQSPNWIVNRHMGAVGEIISIRNTRNNAELLAVGPLELAGSGLGRGAKGAPVNGFCIGIFISSLTDMSHNLQAQLLSSFAFAVMLANESHQTLGQATEANGEGSVLFQHFLYGIGSL